MAEATVASAAKTSNPPSDTEGAEKPVREQLKKTSIDTAAVIASAEEPARLRGNLVKEADTLSRKRSRDEEEDPEGAEDGAGRHVRKRSRDSESDVSGEEANDSVSSVAAASKINGAARSLSGTPPPPPIDDDAITDAIVSPKGKRSRAQFQKDDEHQVAKAEVPQNDATEATSSEPQKIAKLQETDEPGAKRARELSGTVEPESEEKQADASGSKLATTSGFGNASSVSPFASLSNKSAFAKSDAPAADTSKASDKTTSTSASPFGTLGQTSTSSSPFANLTGQAKLSNTQPSAFGNLGASPSGFASVTSKSGVSAFGSLTAGLTSSPFASALSGGKSAFASAGGNTNDKPPILGLSSKPAKPFGAPQSDDEGDDGPDDEADATDVSRDIEQGISSPHNEPKRDKRFVEQEVETGEENERTLFSSRAKLYYFDPSDKSWKERGVGIFKCNITRSGSATSTEEDSSDSSMGDRKARFIMRAEGSQRLILNSPLSKQTKFGDANGQCPKSNTVLWYGVLDGHEKPVGLQLKMKVDLITSLWEVVDSVKSQLS